MSGTAFEFDDGGGIARLAVGLARASVLTGARAGVLVARHGVILQSRVQANASGRPGPNAPTGDYRRSITLSVLYTGKTIEARVGTNKVQGPRLEMGFEGEDSLGRSYHQPAYPHFGPGADQVRPGFITEVAELGADIVDDATKGS